MSKVKNSEAAKALVLKTLAPTNPVRDAVVLDQLASHYRREEKASAEREAASSVKVAAPVEPEMNKAQLRRMREAEALMASKSWRLRDKGRAMARDLAAERRGQIERREVAAAIAETAALEANRGGEVVEKHGRVTMTDRDGLKALFDKGRIDAAGYEAGRRYRTFHEMLGQGLVSSMGQTSSGGKGGTDREDLRLARAFWRDSIDLALRLRFGDDALRLFVAVAGEGVSLRGLVSGGRARDRAAGQMAEMLALAASTLGVRARS